MEQIKRYLDVKEAEIVFSSYTIRPGNIAMTSDSRMFISVNPLMSNDVKVFEIKDNIVAVPYPTEDYVVGVNSIIKGIIGIRVDSHERLWMLDMVEHKFVVWDTLKEELDQIIEIPKDVVLPTSFLQDFVIDERNRRVIIADMTFADFKSTPEPAFVVLDLDTGAFRRMAQGDPSMVSDFQGGFPLNPIAIDPSFEWVYFGASNSHELFRVPAANFTDNKKLIESIKLFSYKTYCDGIAADNKGNIYITNVEDEAVSIISNEEFRNIAMLPKEASWPDGLCIHKGEIYCTVDQLDRLPILNNGIDKCIPPYYIVKTKMI